MNHTSTAKRKSLKDTIPKIESQHYDFISEFLSTQYFIRDFEFTHYLFENRIDREIFNVFLSLHDSKFFYKNRVGSVWSYYIRVSCKDLAQKLHYDEETIRRHLARMIKKYDFLSRKKLTRWKKAESRNWHKMNFFGYQINESSLIKHVKSSLSRFQQGRGSYSEKRARAKVALDEFSNLFKMMDDDTFSEEVILNGLETFNLNDFRENFSRVLWTMRERIWKVDIADGLRLKKPSEVREKLDKSTPSVCLEMVRYSYRFNVNVQSDKPGFTSPDFSILWFRSHLTTRQLLLICRYVKQTSSHLTNEFMDKINSIEPDTDENVAEMIQWMKSHSSGMPPW